MTDTRIAVVGADTTLGTRLAEVARTRPGVALVGEAAEPRSAESAEALACLDALAGLRAGDTAVLCVRRGRAQELVLALLERGVRVVDLSGDHLLPAALYSRGHPELGSHRHPRLVAHATHGLWQLGGRPPQAARLVAIPSPGAAAALLCIVPLARAGLLSPDRAAVVVAAGTSETVEAGLHPAHESEGGHDGQAGYAGGRAGTDAGGRVRLASSADPLQLELEHTLAALLPGPARVTCARLVTGGARGLVAVVSANVASSGASEPDEVHAALESLLADPASRVRLVAARGVGRGAGAVHAGDTGLDLGGAELSIEVDAWSERVTAACLLEPLSWSVAAALDWAGVPQSA